jgi:hypothetical protein
MVSLSFLKKALNTCTRDRLVLPALSTRALASGYLQYLMFLNWRRIAAEVLVPMSPNCFAW